jgi:hypothetical protein
MADEKDDVVEAEVSDEVVVEGYEVPAAERPGYVPADDDRERDERRDDKAAEKRSYA